MSEYTEKEKLMELLNTLYANIVQYSREEMLQAAEKGYYSTRDYALGDTISCSAETAIENCEQIRGYFSNEAPRSAFESVDQVKEEILRLEEKNKPHFMGRLWILIILAAVAFFIYFVMTFR